jgi:hypothetical protein
VGYLQENMGYDVFCAICGATFVIPDWPEEEWILEGQMDVGGNEVGAEDAEGEEQNDDFNDGNGNASDEDEGNQLYDRSIMDLKYVTWTKDSWLMSESLTSFSMEK